MKTLKFTLVLLLISFISCKNQEKKEAVEVVIPEAVYNMETAKTYAELSIKEGGHWEGREYIDGTFKNVTELKVPAQHTDHSWFIRYEGPGWESNKVAYRMYLDWRNCIDIFGKVTEDMILSKVGQDGFDSYHEKSDWGMDILKAGKGLGIGSIGRFSNNEVLHFKNVDSTFAKVENTPDKSTVIVDYYGWNTANDTIDLHQVLSITPNVRYTKHSITPSKKIEGICTGIVKHGVNYFTKESENKQWGYIATYGKQTLAKVPDNLGMAIFYKVETVKEVTDWEHDHLLLFKPTTNEISFYFLAAWEQEVKGIKTEVEFLSYLDKLLTELNNNNKL
ncbi:DUF4861 domain-containing protein [Lutibacter sp. HS1-25]|uniref:DUF4861 family protein n=1 Tax=Lutibacter sp. HS1-25 TaxID=2485000 RepID=UPI0010106CB3|nr:DUF4861 family protein [Lutibacter sp. HS1-25]RXP46884.1 DUF4861 domain-containing protein [Lutibacter sp. HS1-25]